jgi:hypothetical protein
MTNDENISFLVDHLTDRLNNFRNTAHALSARDRVLRLIELRDGFRKLGKITMQESGFTSGSARDRIRKYLLEHKGQIVDGDELSVISGISEYGRRVRELRAEGLEILTGPERDPRTGHSLRPDQYLLLK